MINAYEVEITTAADGSAVDYSSSIIAGQVLAIKYLYGTLAATIDFTIVGNTSGSPIFTIANVAQANVWWFPHTIPNQISDGAAIANAAGEHPRLYYELLKITTAQGGNAATGTLTFYVLEENISI